MLQYAMRHLILLPAIAFLAASASSSFSQSSMPEVLHPKAIVVTYFEIGNDTGDRPGELQFWVERDHLDRILQVPGMTRAVRANASGSEIAVAIGPGNIKPGINLMALAADPRFDLRQSHWLINGIAGISPDDGTVGSAVWTDFIIDGDLAKEIDPREIPDTWPDGFLSLDATTQSDPKPASPWEDNVHQWSGTEAHANRRGNVIRMNLTQLRWAYNLTKNIPLPEDAPMKSLRLRYPSAAGTQSGPKVQVGANMATEIFWHGPKMDAWAHRWVTFETDGVAHLATTAMNDSGTMLALQSLTQQGKANWNNALLLRTTSNFDMPPHDTTPAANLASEKHGSYTAYLPALEAAYTIGHTVVTAWLQ